MGDALKLVGLCGKAGSGKDHTFAYLRGMIGPRRAKRVAFADGVRDEANTILGSNGHTLYDKPYPPEVRALLQWWGTDLRRNQDPDYWVDYAFKSYPSWVHAYDVIVFTDVRFENEAEAIAGRGGQVYEVTADDPIRAERLGGELPPNHASEVMDFAVTGTLYNNSNVFPPKLPPTLKEYLSLGF